MTQAEFMSWVHFYKLYPFDDMHRFYRPAALIAHAGGVKLDVAIDWMQPDTSMVGFSEADINTFKAFGLTPPKE